jgi:aryl-alcohol dehydrogenase-like predicted oxidoreductase
MKYRNLGRSGLSVSRICLGTMNFGPETDEATSHSIMDSALASGLNFFDTANRILVINDHHIPNIIKNEPGSK